MDTPRVSNAAKSARPITTSVRIPSEDTARKTKVEQALGLIIIGLGFSLFVLSAFNYSNQDFFPTLLAFRIVCFLLPIILGTLILLGSISKMNIDTYFYIFALFCQSILAILEGPTSLDFYFYTAVFNILVSLSFRGSLKEYLYGIFPLSIIFIFFPMIFKSPIYFTSVAEFVDKFTAQIVAFVIGFIIARSNAKRFEIQNENDRLKNELLENERQARNIERQKAQLLEEELIKAKKKIEKDSRIYAVGLVASQISHDLKSPLSALNLAIASIENLSSPQQRIIDTAINRINQIAVSVLKSDSKSQPNKKLSLKAQLANLVEEKRTQFSSRQEVDFYCDIQGADYEIDAQIEANLGRVISNLINNAFEAIQTKGQVSFTVFENGSQLLIEVKDNGVGIPSQIFEKIGTEVFTYGKQGVESGSGLGLSYAHNVINSMQGKIEINSVEGVGTKVKIVLPISNLMAGFLAPADDFREVPKMPMPSAVNLTSNL